MADSPLLDPTFLFRFEVALRRHPLVWSKTGLSLPEACRLPCFGALAGRPLYAEVRMAWDSTGIGVWMRARGKRQLPWCRQGRAEESDGLHLWIDTRNSPQIHRANRFCHRFVLMPIGGGVRRDLPVGALLPINRARQSPNPVPEGVIRVLGKPTPDGYEMSGLIPAAALTGFDPAEYPQISLWYAAIDRERGWQTFSIGEEFPVAEDPSLWGTARLTE